MVRGVCVVVALLLMATVCLGKTWPLVSSDSDASGLNVAAADTSYSGVADIARGFRMGNLPDAEKVISADGATELGDVREVEVLADGTFEMSFRQDADGDWWVVVTLGTATQVTVSYWKAY